MRDDGSMGCSCPAWIFQRKKNNGICKHIVIAQELIENNNSQKWSSMTTAQKVTVVTEVEKIKERDPMKVKVQAMLAMM